MKEPVRGTCTRSTRTGRLRTISDGDRSAPPILGEIRMRLDRLLSLPEEELPPKDDLYKAVHYLDSEWKTMEGIFTRGDTALDNNLREQQNRYVSKSGRNSLFFFSLLCLTER